MTEFDLGSGTTHATTGGTEEWTLARTCLPKDNEQMADYLLASAWCSSR